MDKNQKFILEKVKYGLANKCPELMNEKSIERLSWDADAWSEVPWEEWSEWSRKTHWALQVAFIDDTNREKNKDKINEWRTICFNIIRDVTENKRKPIVLDSLVLHFTESDLMSCVIHVFGWRRLSKEEKTWLAAFKRKK